MEPPPHRYIVALGSNRRHHRHGAPRAVLAAALAALAESGFTILRTSATVDSAPLGPSRRRYANAVALVTGPLAPDAMLARVKAIECRFGRRAAGQRWSDRVLDLDIVLWDGGAWASPGASPRLVIPHPAYRSRDFVLAPMRHWADALARDPLSGLTPAHLHARLTRPRPTRKPRP